jgi:GNAT superfamily N-acetyltransferase
MMTEADRAAGSIEMCFRSFIAAMPEEIWRREEDGLLAFIAGLPIPLMNSLTVFHRDADLDLVREMLPTVLESGLPCLFQGRAELQAPLTAIAGAFGLVPGEDVPLMMLVNAPKQVRSQPGPLPTFRELATEERHLSAELLAAGFEAPLELMSQLIELFHSAPNFRMHLAEVGGVPVATSASVFTEPDAVGIFDVATPPEHRRHGYGAAVTAHAVQAGLASGATWAWLQSTPDGYYVYERMGFRTVENWLTWTPAPH